ncbi:MAG: hypothetical protein ACI8ZM_001245 [Crocinitomix sp.]
MTTNISLIILVLLLGKVSIAQETHTDLNLQRDVKKVLKIGSSISKEWPTDTAIYIFNHNGTLVEQTDAHTLEMACTYVKTYDVSGNIIFRKCTGCSQAKKWINTYNEKGFLVKTEIPFDRQTTTFSYDENDRLTRIERVDSSDLRGSTFMIETTFQYDKRNNMIEKKIYHAEHMKDSLLIKSKENNTYFDSNNIVSKEEVIFKFDGAHTTFSTYNYDESGNLSSLKVTYDDRSTESITAYIFEQGRLKSEISDLTFLEKRQLKSYKKETHYDRYGNITKYIDFTVSQHYTYQYDTSGNWIEKITFNEGIPLVKTIRQITYFD